MKPLLCMSLLALLAAPLAAGQAAGTKPSSSCSSGQAAVVQVLEEDTWETSDGKTIRKGQCIAVDASVETGSTGSLTVFFGGKNPLPKTFSCENATGCRVQVSAPEEQLVDSAARRVAEKLWSTLSKPHLSRTPDRHTETYSRGVEGRLMDSVVRLTGAQLDLAPALRKLATGNYFVSLDSLSASRKSVGPLRVAWNGSAPALVSTPQFAPGLYDLQLLEENGDPAGSEAWIFATPPADYASASADFEAAVDLSATWAASASPSAIRTILRIYLESLASSESGSSAQ